MKFLATVCVMMALVGLAACSSKSKQKVLVPLALLDGGMKPQAISATEQGTQAYQAKQFEEAKKYFEQAVTAAPQSGEAHYNYALALNKLGDSETARKQFIEAANLAPGNKIIWDSPPLSPFGNPELEEKKVPAPLNPNHRSVGGR